VGDHLKEKQTGCFSLSLVAEAVHQTCGFSGGQGISANSRICLRLKMGATKKLGRKHTL